MKTNIILSLFCFSCCSHVTHFQHDESVVLIDGIRHARVRDISSKCLDQFQGRSISDLERHLGLRYVDVDRYFVVGGNGARVERFTFTWRFIDDNEKVLAIHALSGAEGMIESLKKE